MTAPVLRTKLFPPSVPAQLLTRDSLLERLWQHRERSLLVLSAPAGFGKSTILTQFRQRLREDGAKVVWLSCEEADSEPQRLLQYLAAAIAQEAPEQMQGLQAMLNTDVSLPAEALIDAFVAELRRLPGQWYLFLDDFHRVRHPGLAAGSRHFMAALPAHIHLVTSTRRQPRFVVNEPALASRFFWLNGDDLRLTADETRHFLCQLRGLNLTDEQISRLHRRTEGWLTALHLLALALQRHPNPANFIDALSGTERNIADYLAEDVLAQLDQPMQHFLEQTSALDEFCAELCDSLLGREDSQERIAFLQHAQLFIIPLDEQGKWFRYHHLFSEFLRARLQRQGGTADQCIRASRWFDSQQMGDKAVMYALRARDYPLAASLLEREGAALVAGSRVYGVLALLEGLPPEVIREYPVFQIFYAWQKAFEGGHAEAEGLIDEVSGRLMQGLARGSRPAAELLVAAQMLKGLVLLYQDKLHACVEVSRNWLGKVPSGEHVFRSSMFSVQAGAHALLGEYSEAAVCIEHARASLEHVDSEYLHSWTSLIEALVLKEQGQLEPARRQCEGARARIHQVFGRHSRVGGPLALAHGDILYEQDRHAAILAELPSATTWRDLATPMELISRGQLVMIRARFYAGESSQALQELDEWLQVIGQPGYERLQVLALAIKVQFLLWLRKPSEAGHSAVLLERLCERIEKKQLGDAECALLLTRSRVALSEKNPDLVMADLERMTSHLEHQPYQVDRYLRALLLLSVATWQKGNADKALRGLETVLAKAWEQGYRRLFVDDAMLLLPCWQDLLQQGAEVLSHWPLVPEMLREQCLRLSIDPAFLQEDQWVSHREREILRLVAAGMSNRDIATTVHLSEATIKWHLHNLFGKLGVRSRTQAVLKGKELGLVSEA
ncbi:LuxR C-terminal-related transcriptional regulator [Atopomonas sediminilitoris]|uniref:LuxR C-terminal-related transcriptional regulator n=1 Tax=Atopomonas sediminilitoris TaxID=2919919 RepID=UPI001F4EA4AB|nr:LuxR C-terminal-related transcriptional regulator [Atopomonas sediminilitoris]MCJ8168565.1 LuxR C-terminal-related transcriptional regulator [Atopomonas sediminilitoris]